MGAVKYSLVVPVYLNESSIGELIDAVGRLDRALERSLEVVFVVDGSPDRSYERLDAALPTSGLTAQLIALSRNFGSFSAVREGLAAARGDYMAMMAADLQEPEALILDFFRVLESEPIDVALGVRTGRSDPLPARIASTTFWWLYRRFVQPEIPPGGIDVFARNRGRARVDRVGGEGYRGDCRTGLRRDCSDHHFLRRAEFVRSRHHRLIHVARLRKHQGAAARDRASREALW